MKAIFCWTAVQLTLNSRTVTVHWTDSFILRPATISTQHNVTNAIIASGINVVNRKHDGNQIYRQYGNQ